MKKKILSVFLAFLMMFTTCGALAIDTVAATDTSSISAKIKKYESQIDDYQKQIEAYNNKVKEQTKGCTTLLLVKVVQSDPFIVYSNSKSSFLTGPAGYYHIIAQDTSAAAFWGVYSGYVKPLGTYTHSYYGTSVPDYKEVAVNSYTDEIASLNKKIDSLNEKIVALEFDRDARIVLEMQSMMSGGTLPIMRGGAIAVDYSISLKPSSNTVVWSSSNTKVATVSNTGVIKCKSAGTATITGKLKVNGSTVKIKVKVTTPLISLKLNYKSFTLSVSDTKQLKTTAKYSTAKYKLYYASSDISVAKVDKNGVVTAVAPGVAYVYAYSDTRVFSEPAKVTVKGTAPSLTKGAAAITLLKDSGILPEGTYFYNISDSSNYKNICNENGIDAREIISTNDIKVGMQMAFDRTNMLDISAKSLYYYVCTKSADIYEATSGASAAVLIASKTLKFNDNGFTNANGDVFSSKDFRYSYNDKTGWYTIEYTPKSGYWYDTNKTSDRETPDTDYDTAETYDYWGNYFDIWGETLDY